MRILMISAFMALAGLAAGCQSIPREMTLGQYCADERRATEDVCKINVEINGTRSQLADTNTRLSEARAIAEQARLAADAANTRQDQMFCETRTLRNTANGSCSTGYTLMSCTQTRFTRRAGAPSIMRSINDEQCRFNSPVLEMQVRCCMAGAAPAPTEPVPTSSTRSRPRGPRPTS